MKVLICGDRNWDLHDPILNRISKLPIGAIIIHGGCHGADKMAAKVALQCSYKVQEFIADWGKHGKAAGPIRNRQMLDEKPDLVIAFHSDLSKSKGTADTVREARKRGIPVEVITQ